MHARNRVLCKAASACWTRPFWAQCENCSGHGPQLRRVPFLVRFLHDRRIRKADKPLDRSNSFCCQPTHLSCCLGRIAEEVAPGKHTHFSEGCRVFDFKYTLSRERSLEVHVAMRVWNMSSWLQHVREQLP